MKSFQWVNIKRGKGALIAFIACTVFVVSCGKEEMNMGNGAASVKVNLQGVQTGTSSLVKVGSTNLKGQQSESAVQQVAVPFDDTYQLVATLVPASNGNGLTKLAATTVDRDPLPAGVQYRVVVYDQETGAYVADKVYSAGAPNPEPFGLFTGKTYTFVSYSVRSNSTVPAVDPAQSLSVAKLTSISGDADFMYDVTSNVQLTSGDNSLDIILKHQFSQINTVLDASAVGVITAIAARIEPHRSKVDVKLQNGAITYGAVASAGKTVSFPTGANTSTSAATIVCSPAVTNGKFTISSATIGGTARTTPLVLEGLKITPGVRYTMELKLKKPDGIDIGGLTWAPGNLVYNPTTGVYSFAANQAVFGNYWPLNSLFPVSASRPVDRSRGSTTYTTGTDPCTKVQSNGGNWKTPSRAELEKLTGGEQFNIIYWPRSEATYNGVRGIYFGTTSQPAVADQDKYLFLPVAGYIGQDGRSTVSSAHADEGSYWTTTSSGGENFWRMNFNLQSTSNYNTNYFPQGHSIRCVKAN
ncbi:hypothetical protein FAZ19_23000 [Sphingobacterium alkalisoli]|uniref:Fibrobacter succinogenes major paralogous domain-containing protein n=1 Tax=Sphingobacterium alkalisoli TaxID=1874115 RepID=A0A4U0GP13_9SPHI|nr:hypothetical protein [Sphingobacterium alkalisoli]TJY60124.1 hypothetical protein FAZ19_23000 [Sphingobacterium alkalisoli]